MTDEVGEIPMVLVQNKIDLIDSAVMTKCVALWSLYTVVGLDCAHVRYFALPTSQRRSGGYGSAFGLAPLPHVCEGKRQRERRYGCGLGAHCAHRCLVALAPCVRSL